MAHQSSAQISAARRVDESAAVAGDIVQYPGHVMLYLGVDRAIVHASNPSTDVELSFVPRPSASATPRADRPPADAIWPFRELAAHAAGIRPHVQTVDESGRTLRRGWGLRSP